MIIILGPFSVTRATECSTRSTSRVTRIAIIVTILTWNDRGISGDCSIYRVENKERTRVSSNPLRAAEVILSTLNGHVAAYRVDPILAQPVEHLEEEKHREHDHETRVELVLEDGHGQTRLCDSIPSTLIQML